MVIQRMEITKIVLEKIVLETIVPVKLAHSVQLP
jgi:hypothetical protein